MEIMADILKFCQTPQKFSHILYQIKTNSTKLNPMLEQLEYAEMLKRVIPITGKFLVFQTTEAGKHFFISFEETKKLLHNGSQLIEREQNI